MNTSVIWFRQIGSINLSRNSPTATGYDTHKYIWSTGSKRFRPPPLSWKILIDVFLRTIMIPLPPNDPSSFLFLVRAVKQPLLGPLFVTLATTRWKSFVEESCSPTFSQEEILRLYLYLNQDKNRGL